MNATSLFTTLAPILALIVLGYVLRRLKIVPKTAWAGIERITYYVLFPALLINAIGSQSVIGTPWRDMMLVAVVGISIPAILLIAGYTLHKWCDGALFCSVFQGGVRFNNYIFLAVVQGLFGMKGLAYGSMIAGVIIVIINLLCIFVFAKWGRGVQKGALAICKDMVTNPLIIGCGIGWFLSVAGLRLHGVAGDTLTIISNAALPLGLLAVGAALQVRAMFKHMLPTGITTIFQFVLKPCIVASCVALTGLSGVAAGVLLIAFMVPTAPSAYILARQLGGDSQAMASIITFQTALAFVAMPLIGVLVLGNN